jgi:hypothetical protein
MVKVMTNHVLENHPDVAKKMEKMHSQDPKKWAREMKPKCPDRSTGRARDARHHARLARSVQRNPPEKPANIATRNSP